MRDLPLPQGSIKYRDAKTMPRVPPNVIGAFGCSTDVSTITQAPLGKSFRHDL